MAQLGRRVDELEASGLDTLIGRQDRLAQRERALLGARDGALDHEPVLGHNTVVREAAHRRDALVRKVDIRGRRLILLALRHLEPDAVDGLIFLSAVVVAVLTSAGDGELHAGRVPRADARDLAQTSVRLARQASHAPPRDDALVSVTFRGASNVDLLALRKDVGDGHLLLEELEAEINLLGDGAAVDLDLEHVRLLLAQVHLLDLRVRDDADNLRKFLDLLDLLGDLLVVRLLLLVARKRLALGPVPVLVKSTQDLIREMRRPHRRERAQAGWRFRVADKADDDDRGRLNDRDSLDRLLLVQL